MDDYTQEERDRIAAAVEAARVDRQWGKEEAARRAGISSITWKRVEDGKRVQATKLRAVEIALEWPFGSMDRAARDRPLAEQKDSRSVEDFRERGWSDLQDRALWDGLNAVTGFVEACRVNGADPRLCDDLVGDAIALMNSVVIAIREKRETDAAAPSSDENVARPAFGTKPDHGIEGPPIPQDTAADDIKQESEGARLRREQDEQGEGGGV